jgi:hypothetical protein
MHDNVSELVCIIAQTQGKDHLQDDGFALGLAVGATPDATFPRSRGLPGGANLGVSSG